jgi:hypothetical protein
MLGEYLARTHKLLIKGAGTIRAGVQMAARENKYHPVIEQLRRTKWDGTSASIPGWSTAWARSTGPTCAWCRASSSWAWWRGCCGPAASSTTC